MSEKTDYFRFLNRKRTRSSSEPGDTQEMIPMTPKAPRISEGLDKVEIKLEQLSIILRDNFLFDILYLQNCETANEFLSVTDNDEVCQNIKQRTNNVPIAMIFDINQNLNENQWTTTQRLFSKFLDTSKILLAVKTPNEYRIIWKTEDHNEFSTTYLSKSDIDDHTFRFTITFLLETIRSGGTGISNSEKLKSVPLTIICDESNKNLLMRAIQLEDIHIIKTLLKCSFDTNHMCDHDETAASLAWNTQKKSPEMLLYLLNHNSRFPPNFSLKGARTDITELKKFIDDTSSLHEAITEGAPESKLNNIIDNYRNLRYFYTTENKSALTTALEKRKLEIYEHLISKELYPCSLEKKVCIKKWSESEKDMLMNIHMKRSKGLSGDYLLILMGNSRVIHEDQDPNNKRAFIREAFLFLDKFDSVRVILEIVAKYKKFKIIFDFKHSSAKNFDPTVSHSTKGVFYVNDHVFIAAKKFLSEETKLQAYGTLIHELCHFAMKITYNNRCRPYSQTQKSEKNKFKTLTMIYEDDLRKNNPMEEILKLAFTAYDQNQYEAELIARVPQLLIIYSNQVNYLNELEEKYSPLFLYYDKLKDEMREKLPEIDALGNKNVERYCEREKQIKKNRCLHIFNIILIICLVLAAAPIIGYLFNNYLKCTNCTFKRLRPSLQNELLRKNVKFNGYSLDLVNILGEVETITFLSKLSGEKVQKFRENDQLIIGTEKKISFLKKFYIQARFSNLTQKNINLDVLKHIAWEERTVIILGEAGYGKSTLLEKVEWDMKLNQSPIIYTGILKLGNLKTQMERITLNKTKDMEFIADVLINLLNIDDDFEKYIFKYKFKNGQIILFWDALNELFLTDIQNKALDFIKYISKNTLNVQWVTSRYQKEVNFEKITSNIFNLDSLTENDVPIFIEGYVNATFNDRKFSNLTRFVGGKLKKLKTLKSSRIITNPLVLSMIVNIYALNKHSNVNLESLYEIYNELVQLFFKELKELPKELIEYDSRILDVLKYQCHEVLALMTVLKGVYFDHINSVLINVQAKPRHLYTKNYYDVSGNITIDKLIIMEAFNSNELNCKNMHLLNLTSYDAKNKLNFYHPTFAEYFVIEYLHTNFFGITAASSIELRDLDTKLRILLFIAIHKESGFMRSLFEESIDGNLKIRSEISNEMIKKFPNIFEMSNFDPNVMEFLSTIFKSDQNVIDTMWNANGNETAIHKFLRTQYSKQKFSQTFENLLALTKKIFRSQFVKVVEGKNQKLNILSLLWYQNDTILTNMVSQAMENFTKDIAHISNVQTDNFVEFYFFINSTININFQEKRHFFIEKFDIIFSIYLESATDCELIWKEMNVYLNDLKIRKLFLRRSATKTNFLHEFVYQNNYDYVNFMLEKLTIYVSETDIKALIFEQELSNGMTPLMYVAYRCSNYKIAELYFNFTLKFLNERDSANHLKIRSKFNFNALHFSSWNKHDKNIFDTFVNIYNVNFKNELKNIIMKPKITLDLFTERLLDEASCVVCKQAVKFLIELNNNSTYFADIQKDANLINCLEKNQNCIRNLRRKKRKG